MEQIIHSPITWVIIAAISEIVALTPLKENSVIELILSMLRTAKPKRAEQHSARRSLVAAVQYPQQLRSDSPCNLDQEISRYPPLQARCC